MSGKHKKKLDEWRANPPIDVRSGEVAAMLEHFFGSADNTDSGGSHDFKVSHAALFGHPLMPGGQLCIPVSGGQRVKGRYIRRLVIAIDLLLESGNPANE